MRQFFLFLVLFPVASFCQGLPGGIWNYTQPKSYIAYRTPAPILIDGKANEPAWELADWTEDFVNIEGSENLKPFFRTRVKILWNKNYFYFYAELEEQNVWADIKQRDAVIFHNNDFEIFLKPYTNFPHYCEFEMNALNTVWDLQLLNAYREGGPIINNWDINGLKTAVHINGTLNDPSDIDESWSVEIAIPRSALNELKFKDMKTETPEIWRINFSRVEWDYRIKNGKYERIKDSTGKLLPEHNWVWSPQGVIDMHQPEFWGYVKFSDKRPGTDKFIPAPDEGVIQALFHLYKREKEYLKLNGKYTNDVKKLEAMKFVFNNKVHQPSIDITNFGYEIVFDLNIKKIKFVINEKGIIKEIRY